MVAQLDHCRSPGRGRPPGKNGTILRPHDVQAPDGPGARPGWMPVPHRIWDRMGQQPRFTNRPHRIHPMKRSLPFVCPPIGFVILFVLTPVRAVILYSTCDPPYNTTAPGGTLTNSGWQFEGNWGGFLGTTIAPKYFITAAHISGSVGDLFTINGEQYTTTAVYDDPDSDLRIWRICGTFSSFAQIYTNSDETNKSIVVIGRGTQRAEVVTTTNLLGLVNTNGWRWGPYDGVVRWGENAVAAIANGDGLFGSGIGDLLEATFDADVSSNECHLSNGDSGGAVFLKDGSTWKLAGINFAV